MLKNTLRKDFLPFVFCPGCGDGMIVQAFVQAVDDLGIRKDPRGWASRAFDRLDFDDPASMLAARAKNSRMAREAGEGGKGGCLAWEVPQGMESSWLDLRSVPGDVRPIGALKFRAEPMATRNDPAPERE